MLNRGVSLLLCLLIVVLFAPCFVAIANAAGAIGSSDEDDGDDGDDGSSIDVQMPGSLGSLSPGKVTDETIDTSGGRFGVGLAFERPIDPDLYIVGVGDQFLLQFWGVQSESVMLTVSPEGTIFIPNLGNIRVDGLNLTHTRQLVRQKVSVHYTNMEYDIMLVKPRTFALQVLGQVKKPGIYRANALMRVSEVLAMAGGTVGAGSSRQIQIWRNGDRDSIRADLLKYQRFGEQEANPYVLSGDIIYIPQRYRLVHLQGEVHRPGAYELLPEEDIHTLVNMFGSGVTTNASFVEDTELIRLGENELKVVKALDLKNIIEGLDSPGLMELQDGDTIRIPSVSLVQNVVVVRGAIFGTGKLAIHTLKSDMEELPRETSGVFELKSGETVRDVLNKTGGVTPWADLSRAYIERNTENGFSSVPIDLHAILIEKDLSNDMQMEPGDVLYIPSVDENIYVTGQVANPGPYTYLADKHASDYLGMAGGPTDRGSLRRTRIIRASGDKLSYSDDPILRPGDTIIVPEKTIKWWQDYLAILVGVATVALAGYAAVGN